MAERSIAVKDLSRSERVKVIIGSGVLAAVASVAAAGIGESVHRPDPLDGTHQVDVPVQFGNQASGGEDMAHFLQKSTNTPDTTVQLEARMRQADPDHNDVYDQGQAMNVPVDVPNNRK